MDLPPAVSNEVNVVGAVERVRVPGHEDHLHDVGDPQVIAADHLNISKRRPPGLSILDAMHETLAPAPPVTHSFTGGGHCISGQTAEHALLAPDPANVLDAMHAHPPVITPRQPRRIMPLRPHRAN